MGAPDENGFSLLVVLGASGGGLEVFQQFFAAMPEKTGMAFVLVQHLDPTHETLIPELLRKTTSIPTVRGVNDQKIEADHIYVVGSSETAGCKKGRLQIGPPGTNSKLIDDFFHAVARDQGEKVVGVVLTGAGSDGSFGLQRVKEEGGFTVAQIPEGAKFDGMPRSAIASGYVDVVLPVQEMPARIINYLKNFSGLRQQPRAEELQAEIAKGLPEIFPLLRKQTGHDFSRYKESTVVRRVQRRMQILYLNNVADYVALLKEKAEEVDSLFKDLLIGVTQFFRDSENFEVLEKLAIPAMFEGKTDKDTVRVWVAGCASGEEAYSIAILLCEHAANLEEKPKLQVFATDLDAEALDVARKGRYPKEILQHVSPARLEKYFKTKNGDYELADVIREICVFSPHNLIKDPPFSRLDLLSCRNVLIYLEADVQQKLLPLFHYALNPCGFLFLGPCENVASKGELFRAVDQRHKLFQRRPTTLHTVSPVTLLDGGQVTKLQTMPMPTVTLPREQTMARSIERLILEEYAPASVIINQQGDVLYFSGNTGKYLEPPVGLPSNKLVAMARKNLRLELKVALHRATTTGKEVVRENLEVDLGGTIKQIDLVIRPLPELGAEPRLYMVLFRELVTTATGGRLPMEEMGSGEHPLIHQLENELRTTKEDLQTTIEELETSNEELKSANEELLSMNEELQSANEELQTSKEEVQSANEELNRKIEEAENAAAELRRAHEDRARLAAIVQNSDDAIIGKNLDGIVTSWNPAAERIFGFTAAEMKGQSITKVIPKELLEEESYILSRLRRGERIEHYETERITKTGRRIVVSLTSSPVRDAQGIIIGAAKIARDITERKKAEEAQLLLAAVVESSDDAIITKTLDGTITSWNKSAEKMYGYTPSEVIGKPVTMLMPEGRKNEEPAIIARLRKGEKIDHYETVRKRKDGTLIDISLTVSPITDDKGRIIGASKIARDISGRKQAEEPRLRLAAVVESSDDAIVSKTLDGTITSWNKGAEQIFGFKAQEMIGRNIRELFPEDRLHEEDHVIEQIRRGKKIEHFETVRKTKSGRFIDISLTVSPIKDSLGSVIGASKIARDITQQKRAEAAIKQTADRLQLAMSAGGLGDWSWNLSSDVVTLSERAAQIFGVNEKREITWAGMRDLLHEEDRERARVAVEQALLDRSVYSIEYRIHRLNNQKGWIAAKGRGTYDAGGNPTGMIGVLQDITERKRTDEALVEERRMLELLNETGKAIASQLNLESLLQQVTDAATKLSGAKFGAFFYNVVDARGESFALYSLSGAPREAFEKFGLPRATALFGPTFHGEGVIVSDDITKDARYGKMGPHFGMPKGHLPVRSYLAVPVALRGGEVVGGLFFGHPEPGIFTMRTAQLIEGIASQAAIAIDNARLFDSAQQELVERKKVAEELEKAREKLRQHAEELEKQVEARTASLREAITQLEEFSYSVSHDLRAPLRAIAGYNQVFRKDFGTMLPEGADFYLERIARSTDNMERLVNDVLTVSRVARAEMNLRPISVQNLAQDIVDLNPTMQGAGVDLQINAAHKVEADETSLRQAISNLLSNAIKFVPAGASPRVRLHTEKKGDMVRIWVDDEGIGIPEQYRSKLFGMFQRLPAQHKYEGTGIGLTIVRRAVERMGGTVGMEPNQPKGSRFWIELKGAE